ncbi:YsnF/AvaK domain-containing protein [Arthrobacter sp. BHU FT2]|nr:YsnF/AvaK domain-containing protein [Arthrobacter sp. BHU FT2]
MLNRENIENLLHQGGNIVGSDGEKIGSIGQLYADDDTGEPTWVTVKTGLFGTSQSFVPVEGAHTQGEDLVVPYTKDHVKDAPRVDVDGHLTPEEEDRLYTHYDRGLRTYSDSQDDVDLQGDADLNAGTPTEGVTGGRDAVDADFNTSGTTSGNRGVGHDTSGPTTDDAMTRSEERLNVGTEREAAGRARLRKYVTTENVTKTVPVQREEVRVEREPITEENRGAALNGPDISEEEHEVVLHEERPVVEKETVPVERVRLDKDVVQDDVTVNEDVRKEHIETDGVDGGRRL